MTLGNPRAIAGFIGWFTAALVLGAATIYASTLSALSAAPRPNGTQSESVTARLRGEEPAMRRGALQSFPGDRWSQGDDFANRERRFVRVHAARMGVSASAVLYAIDEDVRRTPRDEHGIARASVAPCMPRPFYD